MLTHNSPSKIATRSGYVILIITGLIAVTTVYASQGGSPRGEKAGATSQLPDTSLKAADICPNSRATMAEIKYPAAARAAGIQGNVLIDFTVSANGDVKNIAVVSTPNPNFDNEVIESVRKFKCSGQGRDVQVRVPFTFKLAG